MDVFWATDCVSATFAWRSGIASALYAFVFLTLLIATAPPYHPRVTPAVGCAKPQLVELWFPSREVCSYLNVTFGALSSVKPASKIISL